MADHFFRGQKMTTVYRETDDSIEVPEESQKDLFAKLKRRGNVSGVQGTGLGLSIVKGIVDANGGEMSFESKIGKGTTVYCTLEKIPE
jgi:signal transduction histidine kinase